jgi:hypothetical protein
MDAMSAILARQAFQADTEARNYQQRAWRTMAHDGRLWRGDIPYHERYDEVPDSSVGIAVDGFNPTTNPARLNRARNEVAIGAKDTLIQQRRGNTEGIVRTLGATVKAVNTYAEAMTKQRLDEEKVKAEKTAQEARAKYEVDTATQMHNVLGLFNGISRSMAGV